MWISLEAIERKRQRKILVRSTPPPHIVLYEATCFVVNQPFPFTPFVFVSVYLSYKV